MSPRKANPLIRRNAIRARWSSPSSASASSVPGFLVNRMLGRILNEKVAPYEEGVASARDIDLTMKAGAGMPTGPLELADHIGIDTICHVGENMREVGGNATPRPVHIIRKLYHAGRLGKKVGRGFYDYEETER